MENLTLSIQPTISYLGSFLGGILSFFSPCVLPLVPLFFGILIPDIKNLPLTLKRGIAFFIGLSMFFSLLGALAGSIGFILSKYQFILNIIAGIFIIAMGIYYLIDKSFFKGLKFNFSKYKNTSFISAFILGILISFIWIPCSGPVLAAVLAFASTTSNAFKGAFMLFLYSLGISIPFLFLSGIISKIVSKITFGTPKWEKYLRITGSVILILIGILVIFGKFNSLQGV
ncbi:MULTISPECIES: cytochrome c biogenesis CcdA family protein [unclassified Marinitoga]|uniref:cytochrome c biogenesis CcdA family protein n=1 Tax=unclassified Marinitoga TaxID=2640159 RepID=UPI00064161BF|nr:MULTISPECIES: cytochrome c biogenesis CcdA family protein [unclassified Marinitoga]KLO21650.1 cytochrome C biogenesis protein [Marinitoga sp. 1155]NUU99846.1 cytochrome C biogenesis protein [Marinitoga sp. 1154]